MELYFAPLEGITTYTYRNLHNKYFGGIDKYFIPFVAPGNESGLKKREIKELLPENNKNINVVPQILTNNTDAFLKTEAIIRDYGYNEINLNLGCPAGTVVAKGKGAGLLQDTDVLRRFLHGIYEKSKSNISIKTRVGMHSYEEIGELMDIYNEFPIYELIIHPRLRRDFYNNVPNMDVYGYCTENSKHTVCYNGDITSKEKYENILNNYKGTNSIMIGRGLVAKPDLALCLKQDNQIDKQRLYSFIEDVADSYIEIMGEQNALFKLKEIWIYFKDSFNDMDKELKKIQKCKKMSEYKSIVYDIVKNSNYY